MTDGKDRVTGKLCHEMDHSGSTDHSCAATREEGELYDTQLVFKQSCSMPNSTATQLRDESDQMRAEFCKIKECVMAGDQIYPKLIPRVLEQ